MDFSEGTLYYFNDIAYRCYMPNGAAEMTTWDACLIQDSDWEDYQHKVDNLIVTGLQDIILRGYVLDEGEVWSQGNSVGTYSDLKAVQ